MLLLSAVLVSVEVVLRKLFVVSVGGANEISSYVLAISACWSFGFVLLERAHIRIDTFYRLLPIQIRAILDLISIASIVGFTALLSWHVWVMLVKSIELGARSNTPMGTPLWIPQGLYFFGLIVFLVVALIIFVQSGRAFASGKFSKMSQLVGTASIEDELESAIADPTPKVLGNDSGRSE